MLGPRKDTESGRLKALLLAWVAAVAMVLGLFALPAAQAVPMPSAGNGNEPNPTAPEKCGINVAVVVDRSGSIARVPPALGNLKSAVTEFIDGFVGSGSIVSLVSYSTSATTDVDSQRVTTQADADRFDAAINGWVAQGSTNWQEALQEVRGLEVRPDLVVFMTDGRPNTITTAGTTSIPADYEAWPKDFSQLSLGASLLVSDAIRAAGSRMLGVAIGAAEGPGDFGETHIRALTGDREWAEGDDINDFDFMRVASFRALKDKLLMLANTLCADIEKTVDEDVVERGDVITYTVELTNNRLVDVTSDLVDRLPRGLRFLSATGDTDDPTSEQGRVVTWEDFTVKARSTATVTYSVRVGSSARGSLTNDVTWAELQDETTVKVLKPAKHKNKHADKKDKHADKNDKHEDKNAKHADDKKDDKNDDKNDDRKNDSKKEDSKKDDKR